MQMTVSEVAASEQGPEVAPPSDVIQEVWQSNLEEEFKKIRKVIKNYRFVAMVGFLSVLVLQIL